VLGNLGLTARHLGDYERAAAVLEEALALFRELGDKRNIAYVLGNLGGLAYRQGDYERAAVLHTEALVLFRELGDKGDIANSLMLLAKVAQRQGSYERAAHLFGAAEALREVVGVPVESYERAEYESSLTAARAELGEAAFAAAWAEGRALALEQAISHALRDTTPA
jgi:tetratricopeptide (TPR) repeat protein